MSTPFVRAIEEPGFHADANGDMKARCGRCGADCPPDEPWCRECRSGDEDKFEQREELERLFPEGEA